MKETIYAIKMVVKMMLMLLYRSNSEAYIIDQRIAKVCKNVGWQKYWLMMAGVAKVQKNGYLKLANKIIA